MAIDRAGRGKWKVTVDVGAPGERRRISRTITGSERAAQRLERELEGMRDREADPFAAATITVAEVVDRYIVDNRDGWRPNTTTGYVNKADNVIAPAWGMLRVAELDPVRLKADYAALARGQRVGDLSPRRKLAPATVHAAHRLLCSAFVHAHRSRLIASNPMADVAPPAKGRRRAIPRHAADEIGAVLTAARNRKDDDLVEIVQLAIATSARQGELAAIRWRDVTLSTGVLELNATTSRVDGGLVRVDGLKRGEPSRTMTLDEGTRRMLEDRYRRHCQQAADAGVDVELVDDVAVCSRTLEDGCTSAAAIGQRWRRCALEAPSALRFHDLRHFAVTTMLERGLSAVEAADRAGHASAKMTLDVYGHAGALADDRARTALGAAWSSIVGTDEADVDELERAVRDVLDRHELEVDGLVDELVEAVRSSVRGAR